KRVRLHPYYTERVLARSSALAPLAAVAGTHHERLDGTGYHRALHRDALGQPGCVLAAADVYEALTHARPHRAALSPEAAATEMRSRGRAGQLHSDAAEAVLMASGHRRPRGAREGPSGLTERWIERLRLSWQGTTKK